MAINTRGVFAAHAETAYPIRWAATIEVDSLVGGIPSDKQVAENWLRAKFSDNDEVIEMMAARIMAERAATTDDDVADLTLDDVLHEVVAQRHLNVFRRDEHGLYIEGRQLKAAIKEAGSIAVAAGKLPSRGWGKTNKGIKSFLGEHVFVPADRLYLGVTEASRIHTRFPHTPRGTGIQHEEVIDHAVIDFEVITDQKLTQKQWAMIWLTGQQQGIGATRSQGYGRYTVTRWERIA